MTPWRDLFDEALGMPAAEDELPISVVVHVPSHLFPTLLGIANRIAEDPGYVASGMIARYLTRVAINDRRREQRQAQALLRRHQAQQVRSTS